MSDELRTVAEAIEGYFLGDWHVAATALAALKDNGFFVVRRGQAVDHDGNVYNLEVADEQWIIRTEPPALYRLEPLPEEKP